MGWQVDDVYVALDEIYLSGRKIFDRPKDPFAYLAYLLSSTPVDEPPTLLDRAREAAAELERQAVQRAENAARRAAAMAQVPAAPDSVAMARAREIAAAAARRGVSTAAAARAAAAAELRDLAQRARKG